MTEFSGCFARITSAKKKARELLRLAPGMGMARSLRDGPGSLDVVSDLLSRLGGTMGLGNRE